MWSVWWVFLQLAQNNPLVHSLSLSLSLCIDSLTWYHFLSTNKSGSSYFHLKPLTFYFSLTIQRRSEKTYLRPSDLTLRRPPHFVKQPVWPQQNSLLQIMSIRRIGELRPAVSDLTWGVSREFLPPWGFVKQPVSLRPLSPPPTGIMPYPLICEFPLISLNRTNTQSAHWNKVTKLRLVTWDLWLETLITFLTIENNNINIHILVTPW